MNLDRLLPARALDLPHAAGNEDGNVRLAKALAEEAAFPLMRWRVHGDVRGDDVHLWFSLRRRPPAMAPQLRARWQPDAAGGARLVGEFRQDRRVAAAVLVTGVLLAALVLSMGLRGGLALHWTLGGMAFFAGYPWVAWFMHENHMDKINELLRKALATTACALIALVLLPADPAFAADPRAAAAALPLEQDAPLLLGALCVAGLATGLALGVGARGIFLAGIALPMGASVAYLLWRAGVGAELLFAYLGLLLGPALMASALGYVAGALIRAAARGKDAAQPKR